MYYSPVGMFAIPLLDHEQLARLHGMAFGIPSIDDDVDKCEPIPWKLFTNTSDEAPDWVLSVEGEGGAHVIMLAWPADMPYYETLRQAPSTRSAPSVWTQTRLVAMESSLHCDLMYSRLLRAAAQHQSPVPSLVDANGR